MENLTLEAFEEASEIVKNVTKETKLVYSGHFSACQRQRRLDVALLRLRLHFLAYEKSSRCIAQFPFFTTL